ncbi:hypothetical protein LJC22_05630 [Desulfosarcina sp. OttesenSCG-928-G10]|nr:hypothetical protein [Desulfosarcina sp. OttesenSCG-928-G10]MDL2321308.1 hypothetical protein [Desulfosarcina sp. OttesenSCG-928-B08]
MNKNQCPKCGEDLTDFILTITKEETTESNINKGKIDKIFTVVGYLIGILLLGCIIVGLTIGIYYSIRFIYFHFKNIFICTYLFLSFIVFFSVMFFNVYYLFTKTKNDNNQEDASFVLEQRLTFFLQSKTKKIRWLISCLLSAIHFGIIFPVFSYFIVSGVRETKSIKKIIVNVTLSLSNFYWHVWEVVLVCISLCFYFLNDTTLTCIWAALSLLSIFSGIYSGVISGLPISTQLKMSRFHPYFAFFLYSIFTFVMITVSLILIKSSYFGVKINDEFIFDAAKGLLTKPYTFLTKIVRNDKLDLSLIFDLLISSLYYYSIISPLFKIKEFKKTDRDLLSLAHLHLTNDNYNKALEALSGTQEPIGLFFYIKGMALIGLNRIDDGLIEIEKMLLIKKDLFLDSIAVAIVGCCIFSLPKEKKIILIKKYLEQATTVINPFLMLFMLEVRSVLSIEELSSLKSDQNIINNPFFRLIVSFHLKEFDSIEEVFYQISPSSPLENFIFRFYQFLVIAADEKKHNIDVTKNVDKYLDDMIPEMVKISNNFSEHIEVVLAIDCFKLIECSLQYAEMDRSEEIQYIIGNLKHKIQMEDITFQKTIETLLSM